VPGCSVGGLLWRPKAAPPRGRGWGRGRQSRRLCATGWPMGLVACPPRISRPRVPRAAAPAPRRCPPVPSPLSLLSLPSPPLLLLFKTEGRWIRERPEFAFFLILFQFSSVSLTYGIYPYITAQIGRGEHLCLYHLFKAPTCHPSSPAKSVANILPIILIELFSRSWSPARTCYLAGQGAGGIFFWRLALLSVRAVVCFGAVVSMHTHPPGGSWPPIAFPMRRHAVLARPTSPL